MKNIITLILLFACTALCFAAIDTTAIPSFTQATEIRAIWVTRSDYRTPEDVQNIIRNCAKYNINLVLFQVRGNGTVFYKSKLEPWASELSGTLGKDPGWDPLQVAVVEAHQQGIQLHAWLNTMPGWRSEVDPPENVPQLWNTHRDWFMKDSTGAFMIPTGKNKGWYRFLSPGIPEVQDYLANVYAEVVQNYNVDGIHLDYIRHPGEIGDYSYDSVSLARFAETYKATPWEQPDQWAQFRRDNIAAVVRKVYTKAKSINPNILVTSAVVGEAVGPRNRHFTSSKDWFKEGTLDISMSMGYTADTVKFKAMNETHLKNSNGHFVCPGIGVGGTWCTTPELLNEEITIARNLDAAGVTFFAYRGLFPRHQPNALAESLLQGAFKEKAVIPPLPKR